MAQNTPDLWLQNKGHSYCLQIHYQWKNSSLIEFRDEFVFWDRILFLFSYQKYSQYNPIYAINIDVLLNIRQKGWKA